MNRKDDHPRYAYLWERHIRELNRSEYDKRGEGYVLTGQALTGARMRFQADLTAAIVSARRNIEHIEKIVLDTTDPLELGRLRRRMETWHRWWMRLRRWRDEIRDLLP